MIPRDQNPISLYLYLYLYLLHAERILPPTTFPILISISNSIPISLPPFPSLYLHLSHAEKNPPAAIPSPPMSPFPRRLPISPSLVQMAHGCPLNPYDPFEGLYECQPFAKTTQGATAKEIEDDTTAIYTAISAINAMQPVPEYKIRTWRAVKAESAWFNAPPGIDPKSRTARPAPEERRSVAGLERDDPSPRILATLRTKDRVAGLQPPLQTKPTTKSAPRAHTEHADNEYKPQTTPAAAEKTRTTTIRGSAEKCHNTGDRKSVV